MDSTMKYTAELYDSKIVSALRSWQASTSAVWRYTKDNEALLNCDRGVQETVAETLDLTVAQTNQNLERRIQRFKYRDNIITTKFNKLGNNYDALVDKQLFR